MAFSATNLSIMNMGSGKLTIADISDGAYSASDSWASGIPDIQAIIPMSRATCLTPSELNVSFTQSSGTIHIYSNSTTAISLLIISGFAADMTW